MVEQFVEFKSDVTLKGTLTLPSQNDTYPVVVMVHGTGRVDRDENTKSIKINAFKKLADFFEEIGFATLRYDKRGVGESEGSYLETGVWDLVHDATAAVEFVKSHPNVKQDRVVLLGHSEGCWLVPAVYQNVPVDGIILLAGGVGSPLDSSKYQMQVLKEEVEHLNGIKGMLLRWLNVGEKGVKAQDKFFNKLLNSEDAVVRV
ncbi:MAG: alpha/beta fold hydrolase, partial [Bacillota bacterium]|nr:alpha/beta fold hydrolase [Bacillota bacterium]